MTSETLLQDVTIVLDRRGDGDFRLVLMIWRGRLDYNQAVRFAIPVNNADPLAQL